MEIGLKSDSREDIGPFRITRCYVITTPIRGKKALLQQSAKSPIIGILKNTGIEPTIIFRNMEVILIHDHFLVSILQKFYSELQLSLIKSLNL